MASDSQTRLAQAKEALHSLLTGESVVSVTSAGGRSVTYTPAKIHQLRRYIQELEVEVGNSSSGYRGPIRHFN